LEWVPASWSCIFEVKMRLVVSINNLDAVNIQTKNIDHVLGSFLAATHNRPNFSRIQEYASSRTTQSDCLFLHPQVCPNRTLRCRRNAWMLRIRLWSRSGWDAIRSINASSVLCDMSPNGIHSDDYRTQSIFRHSTYVPDWSTIWSDFDQYLSVW
jgi:hypothetical protein